MISIKNPNVSFILVPDTTSNIETYLYNNDYHLVSIADFYNGNIKESLMAFPINTCDKDKLRVDSISLISNFSADVFIKYVNETSAIKINYDGSETPMSIIEFSTDFNNRTFVYEGLSFSFSEKQLYYFPSKKTELKNGMILEYHSNNQWNQRKIFNIDIEWDNMYKLLTKYSKIRIPI